MKKIWILTAVLLLSACGGIGGGDNGAANGSGSTGSGGSGSGGSSDAGNVPTATVALVINRSASAQVPEMKALMAPPPSTNARISITNPNVNGISYKQILTFSLPANTSVTVPIGIGYTFELVTYGLATYSTSTATINFIESYATTTGVPISEGTNTVTLNLNPILVSLTTPTTLYTAQSYTVDAGFPSPSPFQSLWRLAAQTTSITKPLHLAGHASYTTVIGLVAPVNNNLPGTVYFQGEFYLKSSMLNTGEPYTNWVFVYPNPVWSDPTAFAILSVPSGTVPIIL